MHTSNPIKRCKIQSILSVSMERFQSTVSIPKNKTKLCVSSCKPSISEESSDSAVSLNALSTNFHIMEQLSNNRCVKVVLIRTFAHVGVPVLSF